MDLAFVQELAVSAVRLAMMMAAPIMLSGLVVGLFVAIIQAATSIQEQTLTFIPKILAIIAAIIIFGPWIASSMLEFSRQIFELIPQVAIPQ